MRLLSLLFGALVLCAIASGCSEPKVVMPTSTIEAPKEPPVNPGMPKG